MVEALIGFAELRVCRIADGLQRFSPAASGRGRV